MSVYVEDEAPAVLCCVCCCAAGAMLSGLREAARVLQLLRGPDAADAAALVSSRTQTLSKTDKRKRAEGVCTALSYAI